MPTAILLGVTGRLRAPALVLDVQNGYLDRLLMTPIRRLAILLGHMVADVAVAVASPSRSSSSASRSGCGSRPARSACSPSSLLAALWSLAFSGFGYAIALKTGNPAAVNSRSCCSSRSCSSPPRTCPASQLSGWLDTVAGFNPVTYLLEGLRSLVMQGWQADDLGKALVAIAVLGAISMSLCFGALRGRTKRG